MISVLVLAIALSAAPAGDPQNAEALAAQGFALFRAKEYREAADYFLRAYELSGEEIALRNAARAFEEAGDEDRALTRWKEYRALPSIGAEERREADQHIAALSPHVAQSIAQAPIAAPSIAVPARIAAPPPAITERPPPKASPPIVAIGLGGAGVAAVVAGLVTFGIGQSGLSSLQDRLAIVDANGRIVGIDRSEAIAEKDRTDTLRSAGVILLAAGAAGVATSALWLLLAGDGE